MHFWLFRSQCGERARSPSEVSSRIAVNRAARKLLLGCCHRGMPYAVCLAGHDRTLGSSAFLRGGLICRQLDALSVRDAFDS